MKSQDSAQCEQSLILVVNEAKEVAQTVCDTVRKMNFKVKNETLPITVSIGVAMYSPTDNPLMRLSIGLITPFTKRKKAAGIG
ncbi:MAG: hypothetical protein ACOC04_03215 [Halothece sp.]